MNAIELRVKTVDELNEDLQSLVKEQFTHRMQHSTGQLDQTHLLKEVAKNIARVKTVLVEKSRAMTTEDAK